MAINTLQSRAEWRRSVRQLSRIRGRRFILCSCLRKTVFTCFFNADGEHGACSECSEIEIVELSDGALVHRIVCEECFLKYRQLLYTYAERSWEEATEE